MDDLTELVARLEREHDGLEVRVRAIEAIRREKLEAQTARLARADEKQKQSELSLGASRTERAALAARQDRATDLLNRFAGRWWMIRQVTVLGVFVCGAVASWPVLLLWGMGQPFLAQLATFALGLALIPRRK